MLADVIVPALLSVAPSNNTINVSTSPTLTMTFDRNVATVAGKTITITPINPAGADITINVNNPQVSITGAVVTITPTATLNANTVYSVTVEVGAFEEDIAPNTPSLAVTAGQWQFFTGANNMITTATLSNLCLGSSTYTTLGDFSVQEIFSNDFPTGTSRTIILNAPTNFEFQAGMGSIAATGADLSNASIFVTNNQILVFYDVNASATFDRLTFSGIRVRGITTASTGNVVRNSGSGVFGQTDHILPNNFVVATLTSVALPSVPTVTGSPFNYCLNEDMSAKSITASGGTTYRWFSDAALTTQVATGATVTAAALGVSSLTLNTKDIWVANDNGTCVSNPLKITFIINDSPIVFLATSVPSNKICVGQTIIFTGSGSTGIEYSFKLDRTAPTASSIANTAFSAANTYTTSNLLGAGTYTMVITGRNTTTNCQTSTTTNTFEIFTNPVVTFTAPTTISYPLSQNTPVNLTTAPGASVSPAGGVFSGSGISGNNFIPSVAGTGSHIITYTFTSANGCSDSKTITLTVGSGGFIVPEFFCEGDAPGAVSYAGPGNLGGSCDIDPSTVVTGFYGAYAFIVTFTYSGASCSFDPNQAPINANLAGNEFVEIDGQVKPYCNSFAFYFKSYILKKPTPNITGNLTVCEGQSNVKYSVAVPSPTIANHTFLWVVTGGTIVGSNTNNEVFVNWGTSGTGTINVIQTAKYPSLGTGNGQCSTAQTINVTINPIPTPTIGGAVSVCEDPNNTTTYNIVTPQVNHSYVWNVSGAGGAITATTATSVTVKWTTAGTGIISVKDTDNTTNCDNTISRTVNVNPLPIAAITGNANVCVGATNVSYSIPSIAGRTYLWSIPSANGTIASGTATNNASINWNVAGSAVVQLEETINATGCKNTYTRNVFVNSLPIADIVGNAAACANSTNNNYTSSGNTPAFSYNWSVTNGTITSGVGTPTITVTWNSTATGSVSLIKTDNSTSCVSVINTVNVVINPLPTPIISGSNSVCANVTSAYQTNNNVGSAYNWAVTGGFINTGQNTHQITVTWGIAGVGTVVVTETSNKGCITTSSTYNVTKNPLPSPTITGSPNVCENRIGEIYSVINNVGSSYVWNVIGGVIASGQGSNSISVSWGANGVGSVSVSETSVNGCVQPTATSITVIKNTTPNPIITGNTSICENKMGEVYTTQSNLGNTYSWTITGGFITSGANTNQITVTWGAAGVGQLTVTETTSIGCTRTTNVYNVTKNPFPAPVITGSNTVCANSTGHIYQVPNVTGHSYNWTVIGGFIVLGQSTNQITVTWDVDGLGTVTLVQTSDKGCATTTVPFDVTKRALPVPIITGNAAVCEFSTTTYTVPLNANRAYNWTVVGGNIISGIGTNTINVTWLSASNNPASVKLTETINYAASSPFTAISCQNTTQAVFTVTINPLPSPAIFGEIDVCAGINVQTATSIITRYRYSYSAPLLPNTNYVWNVPSGNGIITNGASANQIFIEWNNSLPTGQIRLVQTNTLSPFCSNETTINVTIAPTPYTDFSIANICFGDNTTLTPAIIRNDWTYEWRFSDGSIIPNTQIAVKQFATVGNQTARLVTTNNITGCVTEFEKSFVIYAVPVPIFTYLGSCQAGGSSSTSFTESSTITPGYAITEWRWNFGDGTPEVVTTTQMNQNHSFALPGEYNVTLTVKGDNFASCVRSLTRKITIFPKYTVTPSTPYYENFDNSSGDWIASDDVGNVKNWKYGTSAPDRNVQPKYTGDKYWVLGKDNTYGNNIKTYIETPCFDLSQLVKPILAMKIWVDADFGADGTALFVTYNDGASWETVGDTAQGLKWYNARNLLGVPGSGMTTSNDVKRSGWTGQTGKWENASFALDGIRQTATSPVRFRFAFSSNNDNPVGNWDGFAIDSVFIGERNRRVLIENFTSTQNVPTSEYDALTNIANIAVNETVLLQYFPTFAETNKLSQDNTADPGARSLLYGISAVPRASVDGLSKTQVTPSTWANNEFLRRTLVPSPFDIELTFPTGGTADKLNIKAVIRTNIPTNKPIVIHTVIVEESILPTNSTAPVTLRNVVKRMLPSAAGTFFPRQQRAVGDIQEFNTSWSLYDVAQSNGANPRIYDWSKVAVVIFIQDDETNEIYQSIFAKPTVLPTIISSIESAAQTNNQAIIAPNPAIDEVFIGFEEKTLNDYNIEVVDNIGKSVYKNSWTAEEKGIRFSVKSFAKGMYFVRIYDTRKNLIVTKKLVVE